MVKKRHIFFLAIVSLLALSPLVKWHQQHIASINGFFSVLTYSLLTLLVNTYFLYKAGVFNRERAVNILLSAVTLAFLALCIELLLRTYNPNLQSYSERNNSRYYQSAFFTYLQPLQGEHYYLNAPNSIDTINKMEFSYVHEYNSLGLREKAISIAKPIGEYRIFAMGDSFTEGVGAPADSTWPSIAEKILRAYSTSRYRVYNCGVHGNDIVYAYKFFEKVLLQYRPDEVVYLINSTDINDIVFRGGEERFDSKKRSDMLPSWEFFFGSSYMVRFVVLNVLHYDWQLNSPQTKKRIEDKAINSINQFVQKFDAITKAHNIKLTIVTHPLKQEIEEQRNPLRQLSIPPGVSFLMLAEALASLQEQEKEKIYDNLYWPIDGHFKPAGYRVAAMKICENLSFSRPTFYTNTP